MKEKIIKRIFEGLIGISFFISLVGTFMRFGFFVRERMGVFGLAFIICIASIPLLTVKKYRRLYIYASMLLPVIILFGFIGYKTIYFEFGAVFLVFSSVYLLGLILLGIKKSSCFIVLFYNCIFLLICVNTRFLLQHHAMSKDNLVNIVKKCIGQFGGYAMPGYFVINFGLVCAALLSLILIFLRRKQIK